MKANLTVGYTLFRHMHDNRAKSDSSTWRDFAAMLTAPHAPALSQKSQLPLFSPWVYKAVSDPTVEKGTDDDGKPLEFFSESHVRRLSANLSELTMLVLDYDGSRSVEQIRELFAKWEHVFYTTLNHREEDKDKARVVIPLATPMSVEDFNKLKGVIKTWAVDLGADDSTADIGRMFILPVARFSRRHHAQSWHHEGELLDWSMFSAMPGLATAASKSVIAKQTSANGDSRKLLPDDLLETSSGNIVVKDIVGKIKNVRCPFHVDPTPTEFANITARGTPFLVCKKCGTVYMERVQRDTISDSIAQILAKKKQREEGKTC